MAVVTTGFFDGVHLGHRHLLETVVSLARERGEEAVVVTFWPHPRMVLQQDARELRLLTSLPEKKERLAALGIDRVEVLPFTRELSRLTAREYLGLLEERFASSVVVMGYDNRIGSDRLTADEIGAAPAVDFVDPSQSELWAPPSYTAEGGHGLAQHLSHRPALIQVDECRDGGREASISSTAIRTALLSGELDLAHSMLGYRYELYGVVVAGNRLGRTIGFPTANIQLYEPLKLVPSNGVYQVDVELDGRLFQGMCNIGLRPTVGGSVRTIETHIFDFDEDIYGLPLRLRFDRRIRDERKFPSLDALREQLVADSRACRL